MSCLSMFSRGTTYNNFPGNNGFCVNFSFHLADDTKRKRMKGQNQRLTQNGIKGQYLLIR